MDSYDTLDWHYMENTAVNYCHFSDIVSEQIKCDFLAPGDRCCRIETLSVVAVTTSVTITCTANYSQIEGAAFVANISLFKSNGHYNMCHDS